MFVRSAGFAESVILGRSIYLFFFFHAIFPLPLPFISISNLSEIPNDYSNGFTAFIVWC